MAIDPDLVVPARTAIVLNELQRGTVGDLTALPMLAESGRTAVEGAGRLVRVGRDAGVEVIHCVVGGRPDAKGTMQNTVFAARAARSAADRRPTEEDMAAFADVVPEVGVEASDVVIRRLGGMAPMADGGLDSMLRSLKVTTVVVGGVSLNIGVYGLVIEAVDRGYDVVLARDACAGVPAEYGDAVIEHSLRLITRVTTVDELAAIWGRA